LLTSRMTDESLEALAERVVTGLSHYGSWRMQKPKREEALAALSTLLQRAQEAEREADALTERVEVRLDEDNIYRVYDAEVERRQTAEARERKLREALEDFAKHGVRHDLNPTRKVPTPDSFWLTYIERIDKAVRERALRSLDSEGGDG
jgi:hypothetical protein